MKRYTLEEIGEPLRTPKVIETPAVIRTNSVGPFVLGAVVFLIFPLLVIGCFKLTIEHSPEQQHEEELQRRAAMGELLKREQKEGDQKDVHRTFQKAGYNDPELEKAIIKDNGPLLQKIREENQTIREENP